MGARLRLKRHERLRLPADIQKIFRAMQTYGLIVADNGSDMYISGPFDPRWNNDVLNPAFHSLYANDFEVVQLGWQGGANAPCSMPGAPTGLTGTVSSACVASFNWAAPTSGGALTDYLLEAGQHAGRIEPGHGARVRIGQRAVSVSGHGRARTTCDCARGTRAEASPRTRLW